MIHFACQDVGELVAGGMLAKDKVSGEYVMLRASHGLAASAPCITFLELLPHARQVDGKSCVEDSTHVSGIVFRQTQEIVKATSTPTAFYEQLVAWKVLVVQVCFQLLQCQ